MPLTSYAGSTSTISLIRWTMLYDTDPAPDLVLVVHGDPAAQGSKRIIAAGKMVNVNDKKIQAWRHDVAATFDRIRPDDWRPIDTATVTHITYTLRKPKTAPKRKTTYPIQRPDGDKLDRATMDALTGCGVLADDSRVVRWTGAKTYPNETALSLDAPGAVIALWVIR